MGAPPSRCGAAGRVHAARERAPAGGCADRARRQAGGARDERARERLGKKLIEASPGSSPSGRGRAGLESPIKDGEHAHDAAVALLLLRSGGRCCARRARAFLSPHPAYAVSPLRHVRASNSRDNPRSGNSRSAGAIGAIADVIPIGPGRGLLVVDGDLRETSDRLSAAGYRVPTQPPRCGGRVEWRRCGGWPSTSRPCRRSARSLVARRALIERRDGALPRVRAARAQPPRRGDRRHGRRAREVSGILRMRHVAAARRAGTPLRRVQRSSRRTRTGSRRRTTWREITVWRTWRCSNGHIGSTRQAATRRSSVPTTHPEGAAFPCSRSVELYEQLSADLDFNLMFSQRGHLTLAHSDRAMNTMQERVEVNQLLGIDSRVVLPGEIARLCPRLDLSDRPTWPIIGALYHPPGGTIRHDAVVWGLARGADRRGVEIHYGHDRDHAGQEPGHRRRDEDGSRPTSSSNCGRRPGRRWFAGCWAMRRQMRRTSCRRS